MKTNFYVHFNNGMHCTIIADDLYLWGHRYVLSSMIVLFNYSKDFPNDCFMGDQVAFFYMQDVSFINIESPDSFNTLKVHDGSLWHQAPIYNDQILALKSLES